MTSDQQRKLDEVHTTVTKIETHLLGRGGVLDRLKTVEARIGTFEGFRSKVTAWAAVIAALASISATAVSKWFLGPHK